MNNNYLELNGVCKSFKGFTLNNISFTVPKGYIMGLVGPNGAGKTTTIGLILNMFEKDKGDILVFGDDNIKYEDRIKQDIAVVFDSNIYVDVWKVKDVEKAMSVFYDNWDHDVYEQMIKRFDLPKDKKIKDFSRGMQMKLMLACAFSHNAKLIILDEPTAGLDAVARDELIEILQDYIKDGERSVLFSTHITADLERIADYITFINKGELFYSGRMDDLYEKYRIVKGKPESLSEKLKKNIIGLRKTDVGFEGLILAREADKFSNCLIDIPTIDEIIVNVSHGGAK